MSPAKVWDPLVALVPSQPPVAEQLVALTADQVSVVRPPSATVVGDALRETVGGGGACGGTTVTLTDWVAEPPAPEQVNAKDELAVSGPVEALPEFGLSPLQLPEAAQFVALVDDQVSVAELPEFTVEGAADRLTEGPDGESGGGATPAVTVWPAVPPSPLQVSV